MRCGNDLTSRDMPPTKAFVLLVLFLFLSSIFFTPIITLFGLPPFKATLLSTHISALLIPIPTDTQNKSSSTPQEPKNIQSWSLRVLESTSKLSPRLPPPPLLPRQDSIPRLPATSLLTVTTTRTWTLPLKICSPSSERVPRWAVKMENSRRPAQKFPRRLWIQISSQKPNSSEHRRRPRSSLRMPRTQRSHNQTTTVSTTVSTTPAT